MGYTQWCYSARIIQSSSQSCAVGYQKYITRDFRIQFMAAYVLYTWARPLILFRLVLIKLKKMMDCDNIL